MTLLTDSAFWISICISVVGAYKFTVTYCLKSKCSDFNICWGFLNIKRDVKSEVEIERVEIEHGVHDGNDGRSSVVSRSDVRVEEKESA